MANKRISQEAARQLAIRYSAYNEACDRPSPTERENGMYVWGLLLEQSQRETGIVLVNDPGRHARARKILPLNQDEVTV